MLGSERIFPLSSLPLRFLLNLCKKYNILSTFMTYMPLKRDQSSGLGNWWGEDEKPRVGKLSEVRSNNLSLCPERSEWRGGELTRLKCTGAFVPVSGF